MKEIFKTLFSIIPKIIINIYLLYEKIISVFISKISSYSFRDILINKIDRDSAFVNHSTENQKANFELYTPNQICLSRQETFSNKEPEMLDWIEEYAQDGVLYDIGANIGIYSIYYAKTQTGNVYAFEPSIFNLRQLGKNININSLDKRITIIPNPLSSKTGKAVFVNSNEDEGGALSAFGVDYGHDGKVLERSVEYSLLGFSLDDLLESGALPEPPRLIKIDVDGIEHLILEGAKNTLSSDSCKSVYIEVNDNFSEQSDKVRFFLEGAGFKLVAKKHSDMFENVEGFGDIFNQIWVK